jgi:hypothetical protein
MKRTKVLLVVMLICALSAAGLAQGLVGAPVDPRYGQGDSPDPTPTPSGKASASQPRSGVGSLADALLGLLLATRL